MKAKITFIFLMASFVLFGQSLELKVLDAKTSQPIPFAQVYFSDLQYGGFCDSSGVFQHEVSVEGLLRLNVTAIEYQTKSLSVDITESKNIKILLDPIHFSLDEIEVHSVLSEIQSENVTAIETHSLDELNSIGTGDLGSNLNNIKGVKVVSLGKGISKPVIRGLSGIRVLTYLDGLRIENQQWGSDHGLGASSAGIGGVEIIKGPASLMFGADAIGGVVYLSDESFVANDHLEIKLKSGFESNSLGTNSSVLIKYGKKDVKINVFGSYSNHSDYQIPSGEYVKNSRFSNASAGFSLGYHKKKWFTKIRYNYLNNSNGIPGHSHDSIVFLEDFISDKTDRSATVPVQKVSNHYVLWENKWFLKKSIWKLSVGNTHNSLSEFDEKVTIPAIQINLNNTFLNGIWSGTYGKNKIHAGMQGMFNYGKNGAKAEEILIPNNNQLDVGIYGIYSRKIKDWKLQLGVRADMRNVQTRDVANGLNKTFYGFNFSAGAVYFKKPFTFRINASSGIRPPHISELLSNGPHHGSTRFEIGDRDLDKEQAYQLDASLRLSFDHVDLIFNPFYNLINNYIFINRIDSVIEGYEVYKYQQADVAHLFGGEFGIHYHPHFAHWLHWETSFSYAHTIDKNGDGFPFSPPADISNTLRFEFDFKKGVKKLSFSLRYAYYFAQNNIATYETSSKNIHMLDAGVNLSFKTKHPLGIRFGVQNALNYNYTAHLSTLKDLSIPNPGYNIYFGVVWEFKKDKH